MTRVDESRDGTLDPQLELRASGISWDPDKALERISDDLPLVRLEHEDIFSLAPTLGESPDSLGGTPALRFSAVVQLLAEDKLADATQRMAQLSTHVRKGSITDLWYRYRERIRDELLPSEVLREQAIRAAEKALAQLANWQKKGLPHDPAAELVKGFGAFRFAVTLAPEERDDVVAELTRSLSPHYREQPFLEHMVGDVNAIGEEEGIDIEHWEWWHRLSRGNAERYRLGAIYYMAYFLPEKLGGDLFSVLFRETGRRRMVKTVRFLRQHGHEIETAVIEGTHARIQAARYVEPHWAAVLLLRLQMARNVLRDKGVPDTLSPASRQQLFEIAVHARMYGDSVQGVSQAAGSLIGASWHRGRVCITRLMETRSTP